MSKFTIEIIESEAAVNEMTGEKIEGPTAYMLKINDAPAGMAMGTRADLGPVRDAFMGAVLAKLDEALKAADSE
jgi:hypothetical protein